MSTSPASSELFEHGRRADPRNGESSNEASMTSDGVGGERWEAHPPLERDKRGWQVAPAPDGRGMPEKAPSGPPVHRRPGFLWFVLILLAINIASTLAFHTSSSEPRITIPFNPHFLSPVQ